MEHDNNINFCFVTWVTYCSRLSERMVTFLPPGHIESLQPLILNKEDQIFIGDAVVDSITKYQIPTVTYNVLPDHVHILVGTKNQEELNIKIGNIKGYTSHMFRKTKGVKTKVWAQKFHRMWIGDANHLDNVINYVDYNHVKHSESWGKHFLCGYDEEFIEKRKEVCMTAQEIMGNGE